MNDILTKQALKISIFVDVGGATKSGLDEFLILFHRVFFWGGGYLEPLQQCFQLAAVTFCQLLSRLHLFPESIMRGVTYSWAPVERIYQEFSPQEVREEERKRSFFLPP